MILAPLAKQRFYDNNNNPLNKGQLFCYIAGTTTKQTSYSDSIGTPNTNPVILNYRGECDLWLDTTKTYKFVLAPANDTDPPTNSFWSVDNIAGGYGGTIDYTKIVYDQTAAELAAGVTPVNLYIPSHDVCGIIWIHRYGTNTVPNTTDMAPAFNSARDVAETIIATKNNGCKIGLLAQTYLFATGVRQGWFVHTEGMGPGPTTVNFGDGVTDKCLLLETAGGSYVFGSFWENIQIGVGTFARWGVFSQGSHQHCGLRRFSLTNVNQIGMEFGSLGGPARMVYDDTWIQAGAASPISTTLNSNFVTGNTVITVASTTGFVVGLNTPASPLQRITVVLDSGALFHTTVAAVNPGVSVTLASGLPSNASSGKVLRASRIGAVINSGSNNWIPLIDTEGIFDKGLVCEFGQFLIGGFHSEGGIDIGVSCEQSLINNPGLVTIGSATGAANCNVAVDIAANFIGTIRIDEATTSTSGGKISIRNNADTTRSLTVNQLSSTYKFTTPQPAANFPGYSSYNDQYSTQVAADWVNVCQSYDGAVAVAGRIYTPIKYRDISGASVFDAIALAFDYDTTTNSYELVIGTAVSGSALTEKLRIGKNVIKASIPVKDFTTTVGALPSAASAYQGARAFVTDSGSWWR